GRAWRHAAPHRFGCCTRCATRTASGTAMNCRRSADGIGVTFVYTRIFPPDWPRQPGRMDATLLAEVSWPSTLSPTCYGCGPTSFVERAAGLLTALGHSPDRIRTERFGPTGDQHRHQGP